MSWNYRILRHIHNKDLWYGLHEVFYADNEYRLKDLCTDAPITLAGYDSVDEIIQSLEMMLNDAKKFKDDILNYEDF